MSYQVLARKWRPQTFADVVGQEHVLTALANGLSLGRIHHAYLFSGTRGVGKTSIARLLAKGLNCETGITATPCGVCDMYNYAVTVNFNVFCIRDNWNIKMFRNLWSNLSCITIDSLTSCDDQIIVKIS